MLNISGIHQGFVLDHIKAGESMTIYNNLHLENLGCDCTIAMIMNAKSNKMGRKDIIKIECPIERVDLDILGFIDHNITSIQDYIDSKILDKYDAVELVTDCIGRTPCLGWIIALYAREKLGFIDIEYEEMDMLHQSIDDSIVCLAGY